MFSRRCTVWTKANRSGGARVCLFSVNVVMKRKCLLCSCLSYILKLPERQDVLALDKLIKPTFFRDCRSVGGVEVRSSVD